MQSDSSMGRASADCVHVQVRRRVQVQIRALCSPLPDFAKNTAAIATVSDTAPETSAAMTRSRDGMPTKRQPATLRPVASKAAPIAKGSVFFIGGH